MTIPPIAVVIPAYNESKHIADVIAGIPSEVEHVIVVDDGSTDNTVEVVRQADDPRICLIQHGHNQGVGGAVCSGYKRALQLGADIIVKLDGDGQMDASNISRLVWPLVRGEADYCKGARFYERAALQGMPKLRLVGNLVLSFLTKLVSGYWSTLDPANGFTAIHRRSVEQLPLDEINRGFFFETDMLIHLYYLQAVVADVRMPARYVDERSKLNPLKVACTFPGRLTMAFTKRILWRYFIYDVTASSIFLIAGIMLMLGGFSFGAFRWVVSGTTGQVATTGTVMLSVVPLLLGFQLLLQVIVLDISNVPKKSIQSEDRNL